MPLMHDDEDIDTSSRQSPVRNVGSAVSLSTACSSTATPQTRSSPERRTARRHDAELTSSTTTPGDDFVQTLDLAWLHGRALEADKKGRTDMETAMTRLFGIERPVMQGGMHWVGFAEMAAAVSNAGGLGIITGLTQRSGENLAKEIARCRDMTDKPFGVNLTFLPSVTPPDYPGFIEAIIDGGVKIVETAGNNPRQYLRDPQGGRYHGDPQMHLGAARAYGAGDRLRRGQRRRFRVRRASRRGRRPRA